MFSFWCFPSHVAAFHFCYFYTRMMKVQTFSELKGCLRSVPLSLDTIISPHYFISSDHHLSNFSAAFKAIEESSIPQFSTLAVSYTGWQDDFVNIAAITLVSAKYIQHHSGVLGLQQSRIWKQKPSLGFQSWKSNTPLAV